MFIAHLFIFDSDEFEVRRVGASPSIYVKPRDGEPFPIHFGGRHNALRLMRAVQAVLDTWDKPEPALPAEVAEGPI